MSTESFADLLAATQATGEIPSAPPAPRTPGAPASAAEIARLVELARRAQSFRDYQAAGYGNLAAQYKITPAEIAEAATARDVILDTLAALNVAEAIVSYSGAGDSGDVTFGSFAYAPGVAVSTGDSEAACALEDALADYASDLVEQKHPGWENNDGAEGTVTYDVAARVIRVNHRTAYTAYDESDYEF